MKKIIYICFVFFCLFINVKNNTVSAKTNKYKYENYDWNENFTNYQLLPEEKDEPLIFAKYLSAREFAYNDKGLLTHYWTKHMIVKLNSNDAVEGFNKLSFSMFEVQRIAKLKVRTINNAGKIKELDTSNIKFIENLDNEGPHKLLGIDGLEVGNTLEILYTLEESYEYYLYGSIETLQSQFIRKNVLFELTAPATLKFKVKSLNGLPDVEEETYDLDKNIYRVKVDQIKPLAEEQYSAYNSNLKKIIYKFDYDKSKGESSKFVTWAVAADSKFNSYMKEDEKNKKEILKFIKTNKINAKSYLDMMHTEKTIKTIFKLQQINDDRFEDLKAILKNKYANTQGMTKLFCQILNGLNIEYELAFTRNRFEEKFDKEFEGWNHLNYGFIYIPSLNFYIMPAEGSANNGWLTSSYANCNALYIKKLNINETIFGKGEVKFTEANSCNINHDDIYINLKLDDNFEDVTYNLQRVTHGETTADIQYIWDNLVDEQKIKLYDSYLKLTEDNCKYTKPIVINDLENFDKHFPFTINTTVTDASLWEKAGNKYILKVGTLIGPQSELYNKDKRQNPIENTHNHGYHRVITFTIPEGYQIQNLNDIKIHAELKKNDKMACYFNSDFSIEGNKVTITCDEEYLQIDMSVSDYEDFRKVINAAADFNKVKYIFSKK